MFNPEDYRHLKHIIISHFTKKGIDSEKVSEYSSLTGVPVVVLYTYIKEEFPEQGEFCDERIKKLKEFYGY